MFTTPRGKILLDTPFTITIRGIFFKRGRRREEKWITEDKSGFLKVDLSILEVSICSS